MVGKGRKQSPTKSKGSAKAKDSRRGRGTSRRKKPASKGQVAKGKGGGGSKQRTPAGQLLISCERFLIDLDCAREMFLVVSPILDREDEKRHAQVDTLISGVENRVASVAKEVNSVQKGAKSDSTRLRSDVVDLRDEIKKLRDAAMRLSRANEMFADHALVLFVARFDRLIADLLRVIYSFKPESILENNQKVLIREVLSAKSIKDLRDQSIEQEIDSFLRQSHRCQLLSLDKRFRLGIEEDFSKLPEFEEICQRRHLIIHSGGRVTRQYLQRCNDAGVQLEASVASGEELHVSEDYYQNAFSVLFELGLRLGQSLVRRLYPEELSEADRRLIDWGTDLLNQERWDLAEAIFDFGLSIPDKMIKDDATRKTFLLHKAVALKWGAKHSEMKQLLDIDWSSANARFLLVLSALNEDYEQAEKIMANISHKEVGEREYQSWPALREFRKTDEFRRAYKKLFRREFVPNVDVGAEST